LKERVLEGIKQTAKEIDWQLNNKTSSTWLSSSEAAQRHIYIAWHSWTTIRVNV